MNMDTNPFEAGLGFFIKLDKVHAVRTTESAKQESYKANLAIILSAHRFHRQGGVEED